SRQSKRFFRDFLRNTSGFEKNRTWFYNSYPIFRSSLTFTHPNFCGLFSDRFIRKYSNPNLPFSFHSSTDRDTSSFYLSTGYVTRFETFYSKRTERYGITTSSNSFHSPFLLLSKFCPS